MSVDSNLMTIRARLTGQRQVVAGNEEIAASTREVGAAAEEAGVQAKTSATGVGALSKASKSGASALKTAGTKMKSIGGSMTRAFTVPLLLAGGASVKFALDFNDSMEQIHTQAGASQHEVKSMTQAILNFAGSGKSAEGPNELAKGLFHIESAGYRGARALDALRKSEELATVGHSDFEKVSTMVSAAMKTGIKGTQNLNEAVGLLNATVGQGNMRFEELTSAMGTGILDRAANLGLSLKDVGAAMATLTSVGQPAQMSATRLSMAFNMMANPVEKAEKAMESLGMTGDTMARAMRTKGLIPALKMLKGHLDSTFGTGTQGLIEQGHAISEMFGGGRTSGGMTALLRHIDTLGEKYHGLEGAQGRFEDALKKTNAQPAIKLKVAWAQLQAAMVKLGNVLIPVVIPALLFLAHEASNLFGWISKLPAPVRNVVVGLMIFLAVAGPLLSMIGVMALGIDALAGAFVALDIAGAPVFLVIAGIVALAAVILLSIKNFDTWGKYVLAVISPLTLLAMVIIKNWGAIKTFVSNTISNIGHVISRLPSIILGALKAYPKVFGWIVGFWVTLPIRVGIALVKWAPIVAKRGWEVLMFLKSMPGKAVSALISLAPELFKLGVLGITKFWTGLKSLEGTIKTWLSALPGKMWDALKSGAGALLNAGKELGSEFLSGFLDVIPGPVKDALGFAGGVVGEVFGGGESSGQVEGGGAGPKPGSGILHPQPPFPGVHHAPKGGRQHKRRTLSYPSTTMPGRTDMSDFWATRSKGRELTIKVPVHIKGRKVAEAVAQVSEDDAARE